MTAIPTSGRKTRRTNIENFAFDSMEHFSAVTGIPKSWISALKRAGCPAFQNNRVYLLEVVKWMANEKGVEKKDYGAELKKFTALMKEVEYNEKIGELMPRSDVKQLASDLCRILFESAKRMTIEDPATLEMRDKVYIKAERQKAYEAILKKCQERIETTIAELKGTP